MLGRDDHLLFGESKSPKLQIPRICASIMGRTGGTSVHERASTLARYQLRAGVSAWLLSSSAISASASWCRSHPLKSAYPSSASHRSATLELEEEHLPRLLELLVAGRAEGPRMADREVDQVINPVR
jgi:hypothetical protein